VIEENISKGISSFIQPYIIIYIYFSSFGISPPIRILASSFSPLPTIDGIFCFGG